MLTEREMMIEREMSPNAADSRASAEKASQSRDQRIAYWNNYTRRSSSNYYHRRLAEIYQFLIPPGQRVLELGCGEGDLIASLKPSVGVGVDFSPKMISSARKRHPELEFLLQDVQESDLPGTFDYIIVSDLVNELWDVQQVFERIAALSKPQTRIVINTYSRLWELPLALVRWAGLANPTIAENWLTPQDLENMLYLSGFELIRRWQEILFPLRVPGVDALSNKYLVKIAPFRLAALTNFLVARPSWQRAIADDRKPLVSVVIPARNEEGNVENIFRRVPEMGAGTELIFVEGGSKRDVCDIREHCVFARNLVSERPFAQRCCEESLAAPAKCGSFDPRANWSSLLIRLEADGPANISGRDVLDRAGHPGCCYCRSAGHPGPSSALHHRATRGIRDGSGIEGDVS